MFDDDAGRFATALKQGLDAIARDDRSALRQVADELVTLGRTTLADAPWWLLQGAAPDIARLAMALAEGGERGRARDLLLATASFFTHTGGVCNDMAERVLAGDDDALFDFVREAHSPGLDLEALGMDEARIVALVRRRLAEPSATEATATFALGYVRERDELDVLAAALARFPDNQALWERAARYFLGAGQRREALVAYCRSLDARVPPAGRAEPAIADDAMNERLVALRRSWTPPTRSLDEIMIHGRCVRASQPTLINVALLCRELDGTAAARDVVARYAAYEPPRLAAIAFVDAGAGDEAIAVLLRALQGADRTDHVNEAVALGRIYLALGRSVEAVAAARVLLDRRRGTRDALDVLLKDHHLHRGPAGWQGLLPAVAADAVRDAAIDELVRGCSPGRPDHAELVRRLRVFDDGSPEARAESLALLRRSGRRLGAVVREQIDAGPPRMRVRLGWLLEEWAWEAAEERFRSATGLRGAVVSSAPPDPTWIRPEQRQRERVSARLDTAIECLREVELGPAYALVDWICEQSVGRHDWRLDPEAVAHAAELLVCEGQVERAGRLLRAAVRDPRTLQRFRDMLAGEVSAAFDALLANRRAGSSPDCGARRTAT